MFIFRLIMPTVIVTAATVSSAQAQTMTVQQMAQSCRSEQTYCAAYINGIQTMMQANCQLNGLSDFSIGWFPSSEAGRSAFLLWAANNPDQSNVPAFHGVVSALRKAFPCK